MNALVELIKRIGIFMIAAQAVIHFAPGQKYEKYIKLLVGIMILLQFVIPMRGILNEAEIDWNAKMADMERTFEAEGVVDGISGTSSVTEAIMNSLENEIKSKLNNEIAEEDYVVSNVRVAMRVLDQGAALAEAKQYELENVRVVVYRRAVPSESQIDGNAGNAIEKIQIEKVHIGGTNGSEGSYMEEAEETAEQLRERFCAVLGMDEEKMEVSVYGTNEKADR